MRADMKAAIEAKRAEIVALKADISAAMARIDEIEEESQQLRAELEDQCKKHQELVAPKLRELEAAEEKS